MPAKGGNADLTDDEVRRAVAFMANKAGANFKESTPAATIVAAAPAAAAAPIAAATSATTAAAKPDGKKIWEANCAACHGTGLAGAPKIGDKALWAPRIAQGINVLYTHALGGFTGKSGVMPPKGGNLSLPDPEIKAAVDYMVAAAK